MMARPHVTLLARGDEILRRVVHLVVVQVVHHQDAALVSLRLAATLAGVVVARADVLLQRLRELWPVWKIADAALPAMAVGADLAGVPRQVALPPSPSGESLARVVPLRELRRLAVVASDRADQRSTSTGARNWIKRQSSRALALAIRLSDLVLILVSLIPWRLAFAVLIATRVMAVRESLRGQVPFLRTDHRAASTGAWLLRERVQCGQPLDAVASDTRLRRHVAILSEGLS